LLLIFDLDDTLYSCTNSFPDGKDETRLSQLTLFAGVKELLENKNIRKIIVTKGENTWQQQKIAALNIGHLFDKILICPTNEDKKTHFKEIINQSNTNNIIVVGNRIDSEIRYGNELGLKTVLLHHGKYKDLKPKDESEIPSHLITRFEQLPNLLK
jgi:FMN phosphatase YigB (HAD superfamily)